MKMKGFLLLAMFLTLLVSVSLAANVSTTEKSQIVEDVGLISIDLEISTLQEEVIAYNDGIRVSVRHDSFDQEYIVISECFELDLALNSVLSEAVGTNTNKYKEKLKTILLYQDHSKKWVRS